MLQRDRGASLSDGVIAITINIFVFAAIYLVSAWRTPDLSDEGLYLYDAWAAYRGGANVGQSFFPQINEGYLVGLPYLLFESPGILGIRLFLFLSWMLGFGLFLWAFGKRIGEEWLVPLMLGFFLQTIFITTPSYQTIPFFLVAAAAGLILIALDSSSKNVVCSAAFLVPFLLLLSVIPYTPAIALAPIGIGYCMYRFSGVPRRYSIFGSLVGVVLLACIFYTEYYASLTAVTFPNPTLRLQYRFERWLRDTFWLFSLPCLVGGLLFWGCNAIFVDDRAHWKSSRVLLLGVMTIILYVLLCNWISPDWYLLEMPKWRARQYTVYRVLLIVFPFFCYFFFRRKEQRLDEYVSLFLIFGIAGIQEFLGGNRAPFYSQNIGPLILGLSIMGLVHSARNTRLFRYAEPTAIFLCVSYTTFSICTSLTMEYRGASALGATTKIEALNFKGSYAEQTRAEMLHRAEGLYHHYGCDQRSFVAIDRLPLMYFVFNRASQLGRSWTGARMKSYAERIRAFPDVCIFYRRNYQASKEVAEGLTIFEYLELERSSLEVLVHEELPEENIMFLVYRKASPDPLSMASSRG